jgi:hypothetical protein
MTSMEELIDRLIADLPISRRRWKMQLSLGLATFAGSVLIFLILWFGFSHSAYLANSITRTVGFTILAALTLAAGMYRLVLNLSRPEADAGLGLPLGFAALILVSGIAIELWQAPPYLWRSRVFSPNSIPCFISVTLLGLPILLVTLLALRHGATVYPARVGAAAGFLAGGITGALYEIHCPEGTLLFVAIWHVAAILLLAGIGALLGRPILRW